MTDERKPIKLEAIDISSPCPMLWENLEGGDKERFCRDCGKHVHDLSALTKMEAEALLRQTEAKICVSYEKTATGGIKTRDYSQVFYCSRESVRGAVSLVASALVAVLSNLPALAKDTLVPSRKMGKIAAPVDNSTSPMPPHGGNTKPPVAADETPRSLGAPAVRTTGEAVMRTTGMVAPSNSPAAAPELIAGKQIKLTEKRPGLVTGVLVSADLTIDRRGRNSATIGANQWSKWQATVAQALFKSWKAQSHTPGQITLRVTVQPGKRIAIGNMGVPHLPIGTGATETNAFISEVQSTIADLQQESVLEFPNGGDLVQQAAFTVTMGADKGIFPRQPIDSL